MLESDDDKNVFVALYEQYEHVMYNIAYSILHDQYLGEDAVHDAFLKIIKYINVISEVNCHKTKALVVTIIKSTAIDIYRKQSRQSPVGEDVLSKVIDTNELPLDHIIAEGNYNELLKKLKKLKKIYLEIILLKYHYHYSDSEISQILCISDSAVRKRLSRARLDIKRMIEGKENEFK
jgi:RNA polymerase sigma-70 factor (ECF subfamily)